MTEITRLTLVNKLGDSVHIGEDITVTFIEFLGNQVKITVDAPRTMKINRGERIDPTTFPTRRNRERKLRLKRSED